MPYIPALLLAVISGAALGLLSDRLVFRRLIEAPPMAMVVATVALSFLLKGIARFLWGGQGSSYHFRRSSTRRQCKFWDLRCSRVRPLSLASACWRW